MLLSRRRIRKKTYRKLIGGFDRTNNEVSPFTITRQNQPTFRVNELFEDDKTDSEEKSNQEKCFINSKLYEE
jgi:hypothetical protein